MNDKDKNRLTDMLNAAQKTQAYIAVKSREDLESEQELLGFALVHAIQVIGEAAAKITPKTRQKFPHIEWHNIIGMRNRIVHDYLHVDYDIVWVVVTKNLPSLIEALNEGLNILQSSDDETDI